MPKAKATELPGLKSRWKPQITNDDVYVVTGITGNFDGEVWITAEREADRISIIRRVDQFYESMAPEPTTKAGDNIADYAAPSIAARVGNITILANHHGAGFTCTIDGQPVKRLRSVCLTLEVDKPNIVTVEVLCDHRQPGGTNAPQETPEED